jgi:hypothetical protein
VSATFIVVSTALNSGTVVIFVYEVSGVFSSFKHMGTLNLSVIFTFYIELLKIIKKFENDR